MLVVAVGGVLVGHDLLKPSGSAASPHLGAGDTTGQCSKALWPRVIATGTPSAFAAAVPSPGVYIWKTFYGPWHVRIVGLQATTGTVKANAGNLVATEAPAGNGTVSTGGTSITFSFPISAAPVGMDIKVPCQTTHLTVSVKTSTGRVPTTEFWIGPRPVHPQFSPATFNR